MTRHAHVPAIAAAVIATAALAPAPAPAAAAEDPTALQCSGNEPFWRLDMGPGTALLQRPAGEEVEETTFTGTLDTLGYLDPPWHVWRGTVASGDGADVPAPLVAMVREEACRDSMKGDLRDGRAVVTLPGGGTVSGCCRLGPVLAEAPTTEAGAIPFADYGSKALDDWSRDLPNLLPAIRACVRSPDMTAEQVLKAWPMNRGMVGVRIAAEDGGTVDCTATTGGRVETVETLAADAAPLPGQGEPVFLPGRTTPPDIDCGRLERVSGAQGQEAAGYLLYDQGCG